MEELKKRAWVYIQYPDVYGVAPCLCGNAENQCSEYQNRVWCDRCEIDFEPMHWGVLDGPIGLDTCRMLGMVFDRYYIKEDKVKCVEEYLNLRDELE